MNPDDTLAERLRQPIEGYYPAGVVLHSSPELYRPFRNTLNLARSSFRALEQNPEPEQLDELRSTNNRNWQQVSELIITLLEENSRDLDLLGWLLYSRLFTDAPYQSLHQCLVLIQVLLETYGALLRPPGDEEIQAQKQAEGASGQGEPAQEDNLSNKNNLSKENDDASDEDNTAENNQTDENEKEPSPFQPTSCNSGDWIKKLKICQQIIGDVSGDGLVQIPLRIAPLIGVMSLLDYQHGASRGQMESMGKRARSTLKQDRDSVIANIIAVQSSITALQQIETTLASFCSDGASSHLLNTQPLQSCLNESLNAAKSLLGQLLHPWPGDEVNEKPATAINDAAATKSEETPESAAPGASTDRFEISGETIAQYIKSQDHALDVIRALSSFFRQTQPYSPVSYILEKALRMAQLTLPEFLQEVMNNDSNVLGNIYLRAGLDLPDKSMPVSDVSFTSETPEVAEDTDDELNDDEETSAETDTGSDAFM